MKHPIEVHERELASWKKVLEKERRWHENQMKNLVEREAALLNYELQITLAKKKGLKEFDRDKFGKRRLSK